MSRLLRNPRARVGAVILVLAYAMAALSPWISPYDPARIPPDTAVNRLRPPGAVVFVLTDRQGKEHYCLGFREDPDQPGRLRLDRGPDAPETTLAAADIAVRSSGDDSVLVGEHRISFRRERHPLGTDELGRDLAANLLWGSRISLTIGFVAMLVAVLLGSLVGTLAAYFGGWVDVVLMRFTDLLLAFPRLLMLLLIYAGYAAAKQEAGIFTIVLILGLTGWMGVARLVRAEILTLRERDFAVAARALGLKPARIMVRHFLPNAAGPIIVDATLRVGNTILLEAALSFLGMGVQRPTPSWGNIVQGGADVLADAWWIATLPGIAIVLVVASFNLLGDGLRDALDPRLREGRA